MANKPNKNRETSVSKSDKSSPKRSPKTQPNPQKQSKPKGSLGLGLLLIAIGTSLIGLGGLGYLFYQELLSSSKREVESSTEAQTIQIDRKLANVKQSVESVARAISIQQPKPKTVEAYQKLVVEGLQNLDVVAGMGIAQNETLLFTTAKPTVPYIWKEKAGLKLEVAGQKLASPNDKLQLGNRLDILNSPFYKASIASGKASWTEPYTALGKTLITYNVPISDGLKTVGVINADVVTSDIFSLIDTSTPPAHSSESKIGYAVVSSNGKVITGSYQFQATQTQSPAITQVLTNLAQQSKTQATGILQSDGYLWTYRKIEGSDLLVVANFPESEITNKLILLVGGVAIGISAILAIAVLGFVNSLKKRIKPLTEECDRFLSQQGNTDVNNVGKDEIDRLSLSLKNTFQQVKTNEIKLRSTLTNAGKEDVTAAQIQQNFAETELIEAEVGDLLDVVSSMEEGDLTIEAQVNDRATGLVADTLNRLREKLVEIISSVLGTAQQVAQGASDLEELAKTVVLNTAEQAQSVAQGQALTEQVATIAQRSATQINVANQSLQEVRDTVASGQTAINSLTDSISVLQTGSAKIVQRMKTLGEFVGLAEQFVQDQGQIASLTQVLALNATLVAARAAEQKDPKQFAGVAREFESIAGQVNDLATQTNDGLTVLQQRTSQIQTVVTAIDVEVQNLSGLVSGFTTGAESSQSAFNSIQIATQEVAQIGQTITASSTEIADAAGSTASYISEIAQLADRTADLTRAARQQAEEMGNQAQQLLQGIKFFRLPDSSIQSTTTDPIIKNIDSTDTSINSLLETSTASNNTDSEERNGNIIPIIAGLAAAATYTTYQSGQASSDDDTKSDVDYLINHLNDDNESSEAVNEEILLSELKQEVYEDIDNNAEAFFDNAEVNLSEDYPPSIENPMHGIDQYGIDEISADPMIDSATSSFLEDTAFGIATPLSEDSLINVPTSVDFSIPDLDYEDFEIPKTAIESSLDDSSSFFDDTFIQEVETQENDSSLDVFNMEQPPLEYDNSAEDDVFDSNLPDENISNDAGSNTFEDYSFSWSDEAPQESFPLSEPSNDTYYSDDVVLESDTHNLLTDSFVSLEEENISESWQQSLDNTMDFDQNPFIDLSNDSAEDQDSLSVGLTSQAINTQMEDSEISLNELLPEVDDLDLGESFIDDSGSLVETDSFFDSIFSSLGEDLADPFDIPTTIQFNESSSEESAIASDFAEFQDLSTSSISELSTEQFDEFSFDLEDNLSTSSEDLSEPNNFFHAIPNQVNEELIDTSTTLVEAQADSIMTSDIPSPLPPDEVIEDIQTNLNTETYALYDLTTSEQELLTSDSTLPSTLDVSLENVNGDSIWASDATIDSNLSNLANAEEELFDSSISLPSELDESIEIVNDSAWEPNITLDSNLTNLANLEEELLESEMSLPSLLDDKLEDFADDSISESDAVLESNLSDISDVQQNLIESVISLPSTIEEDMENVNTDSVWESDTTLDSNLTDLANLEENLLESEMSLPSILDDGLEDVSNDSAWEYDVTIDSSLPTDLSDTERNLFENDISLPSIFDESMESFTDSNTDSNADEFAFEESFITEDDNQAKTLNLPDNFNSDFDTPDFSEMIGTNTSNLNRSLESSPQSSMSSYLDMSDSSFELPEFVEMSEPYDLEPDNLLLEQGFNFDLSDDYDIPPNVISDLPVDTIDELLNDVKREPSESDLEAFSIFDDNLDSDSGFDFEEIANISDDHEQSFYAPESVVVSDGFEQDLVSGIGQTLRQEASALSNFDQADEFNYQESVVFESSSNDLEDLEEQSGTDSVTSAIDSMEFSAVFGEPMPDNPLDLSDNWLEDIVNEEDSSMDEFDDLTIYPSLDNTAANPLNDSDYGFADNLLESLMSEADEGFTDLSMPLSDLSSDSTVLSELSNPELDAERAEDTGSTENSDSKFEFDFSAFVEPIDEVIFSARAEIDEFLSGSLELDKDNDESPKTGAPISLKNPAQEPKKENSEFGEKT